MKMKKILALLLCALLIVSVFAACGNNADKTTDTTKKIEDVTEPVETDPAETEPEETGETVVEQVVKFQLFDKDGNALIDTTFNHEDGKVLFDEIKENFKIVEAGYVTGIFTLDESVGIQTDWDKDHNYLALYIDGEYSMVGINEVTYHDGIVIKWVESN